MSEYVPSDEDMAHWFEGEEDPEYGRALWGRWLAAHDARVAREALDGLAMRFGLMGDYADLADQPGRPFWEAQDEAEKYRDEFYPRT